MPYDSIELHLEQPIARLTLNRPDNLNTFTRPMLRELLLALETAADTPGCRALLIVGAGRAFCAGQDLAEPGVMEGPHRAAQLHDSLENYYHPVIHRLRGLELPVVAAVGGVAAGAGCNFALACDFVVAGQSAQFIQAFSRIGLVPDCGGSYHLPRLVGEARARRLAMLGDTLSAEQAADWGLIHAAVPDDRLLPEATALAERLAAGPTRAYALIKQAIAASADHSLETQMALEADLQQQAAETADFQEGVKAFYEKRPARFLGN